MPEDKLTQHERLRLEALNQAVQCSPFLPILQSPEEMIERAKKYADWIQTGRTDDDRKRDN